MGNLRYQISKWKSNVVISFWSKMPNSWIYYAVNQAWAKATTQRFTDRHPDDVRWSDVQKFLEGKP